MEWIQKMESSSLFTRQVENNTQHRMIKRVTPFESPIHITTLAQFFLSLSAVNGSDNVMHIPTPSEQLFQKVLEEVGAYFEDIKATFVDDNPQHLILKEIKSNAVDELKKMEAEGKLNPIVANLFNLQSNIPYSHREKKTIVRIIPSEVKIAYVPDFDETMEIIRKIFDDLLITPTNWYLTNDLKESIAITYFAHRCKHLYLWVDNSNLEIIYIHLEM